MSFGSQLRQLRTDKNLRQKDLAEIIDVNRATIGKYETDERFPDRKTLGYIADYFHVSVDFLLDRTDIRSLDNAHIIADQKAESAEASIEDETVTIKELLAFVKEVRQRKDKETEELSSSPK